jgi:hypothetical protein
VHALNKAPNTNCHGVIAPRLFDRRQAAPPAAETAGPRAQRRMPIRLVVNWSNHLSDKRFREPQADAPHPGILPETIPGSSMV